MLNFAESKDQNGFKIIPDKTCVKARFTITLGHYNDIEKGYTGNWATLNEETGSIYLKTESIVLNGEFKDRKIYGLVGLYSPKGPTWAEMGQTFIKALLQSARNVSKNSNIADIQSKLCIENFGELNNLEFAGVVSVKEDNTGKLRNEIKYIITPDDVRYLEVMGTEPNYVRPVSDFDDEIPFK